MNKKRLVLGLVVGGAALLSLAAAGVAVAAPKGQANTPSASPKVSIESMRDHMDAVHGAGSFDTMIANMGTGLCHDAGSHPDGDSAGMMDGGSMGSGMTGSGMMSSDMMDGGVMGKGMMGARATQN